MDRYETLREAQRRSAKAAQPRLSADYGIPWRPCTTEVYISKEHPEHHEMPPWLNIYDKRKFMFDGELMTMFQDRLVVLALRKMGLTRQDIQDAKKLVKRFRDFPDWRATLSREQHQQVQCAQALLSEFEATQKLVRPEVEQITRTFLEGWTDRTGNYWCGQCHNSYLFMELGYELDYPALWASETAVGYDAWLHTARFSGCVCVESGLRLGRKIKDERQQIRFENGAVNSCAQEVLL